VNRQSRWAPLAFCALATVPFHAHASATIVIQNANDPGVGFNDPTPAQPVGGNPGTTVGQQRLIAFKYAAFVWGMAIDSNQTTILISAKFESLTCSADTGILGSASPAYVEAGSFPLTNYWYPAALGNSLSRADQQPGQPAINTHFNSDIGGTNCLTGDSWYYGLDGNVQSTQLDLVAIALHEFAHGLGFFTTTDGSTGALFNSRSSVFDHYLLDNSANRHWDQMTDAQRMASAINTRKLVWDGQNATAQVPVLLQPGTPALMTQVLGGDDLVIGVAAFGPALTNAGVSGTLRVPSDNFGCQTLSGLSPGTVALIDRGPTGNPCTFIQKVRNAQAAGAIAVVVVDNVTESPPPNMAGTDPQMTIIIPSAHVTLADGNALKNAGPVTVTLHTLPNVRAGADANNHPLLYTPNPFKAGSSIPHNDTSTRPHLLMQPDYSTNLGHNLDLTAFFLKDLGWQVPNPNPTVGSADVAISVNGGSNFSYNITVNNVGPSAAVDVTVFTVAPSGVGNATASGDCTGAFPCQLGTIAVGSSKSFTAKFNAPSNYTGPRSISTSFTAASAVPDPVTSNNSASASSNYGGGGCNSSGAIGLSSMAALAAIALALGRRRARVRA
jgi:hypothetical protein